MRERLLIVLLKAAVVVAIGAAIWLLSDRRQDLSMIGPAASTTARPEILKNPAMRAAQRAAVANESPTAPVPNALLQQQAEELDAILRYQREQGASPDAPSADGSVNGPSNRTSSPTSSPTPSPASTATP